MCICYTLWFSWCRASLEFVLYSLYPLSYIMFVFIHNFQLFNFCYRAVYYTYCHNSSLLLEILCPVFSIPFLLKSMFLYVAFVHTHQRTTVCMYNTIFSYLFYGTTKCLPPRKFSGFPFRQLWCSKNDDRVKKLSSSQRSIKKWYRIHVCEVASV